MRVVTWLDGIPYGDGVFPDAHHLLEIGQFMGEMVNALRGFDHPASHKFMPWNLSNGIAVSRNLWQEAEADIRAAAAPMLDRLREDVLPRLNACPSQVIHNDGHPYNLLRADADSQAVAGLIDFGDMVYAPILNELVVTATTFQRRTPGDLTTLDNLLRGFLRAHPLSETEVSLIWDAMTLRLLITVLLSDIKCRLGPDPDAQEDRKEALVMLRGLSAMNHAEAVGRLLAVAGYTGEV